jgi:hypothetical protein
MAGNPSLYRGAFGHFWPEIPPLMAGNPSLYRRRKPRSARPAARLKALKSFVVSLKKQQKRAARALVFF